jgi:hypothetical protein
LSIVIKELRVKNILLEERRCVSKLPDYIFWQFTIDPLGRESEKE